MLLAAYGLFRFRSHHDAVERAFHEDLPLLKPLADKIGWDLENSSIVHTIRTVVEAKSDTLLRRVVKEHNLDANKDFQAAKNAHGTSAWRSMMKAVGLASDKSSNSPDGNTQKSEETNSSLVSADEIAEALRLSPYVDLIKEDLIVEPVRESRATVKDTRLIEISYRNTNPELAAFVVNAIGETFVNANQEKRSGTSRKTSDFLQKRINDLQTDIRGDEIKLVELKQSEGILKTAAEQQCDLIAMTAHGHRLLGDLLFGSTINEVRHRAQRHPYCNRTARQPANPACRSRGWRARRSRCLHLHDHAPLCRPQIAAARARHVRKKINDLNAEKARKLEDYKETAPEIIEIDKQIASLEDSLEKLLEKNNKDIQAYKERSATILLENYKTQYQQAKDQETKIRSAYDVQYNEAQGQNSGAVMIKLLEQTIETNRGFLDNLRKQQSGNDVASQGSDNNISVASFGIPPEAPVAPRRLMTVVAALLLSSLFGMGLALFLEYLDDTINTTEEVENLLQLPALTAIPTIDSIPKRKLLLVGGKGEEVEEDRLNSELLIFADPRSSLSESYRQLRTSILLSTAGHAPKSLLITSSLPSEGKTTTATNTAISLGQTGAKVLIIDADMRRPRLHSVFNVSNNQGISTVLSSELSTKEILDVINYDERTKVSVMTSGPIPPNPAELIGSEQMVGLLKTLQSEFTHVVIDSPPITSFTDGVLLASLVDGVILVVHSGKSSRQVVRRARQLLIDVRAKVLGVVLNNVNLNSQDNYYYYQSYYYRNNYRHTDEGE